MGEAWELDGETIGHLMDVLGELVARAGAKPLLLPPVGADEAAFPDPWQPTRAGVALLLRRLVWHAGLDLAIEVDGDPTGARPTERMPATRVSLVEIRGSTAVFGLEFIGSDDVAGTLAHEIGVAFAVLHRHDRVDPYRISDGPAIAVDSEVDLERGSIAAVYLGLGVLATNAALQSHAVYERAGFHPLLVDKTGVKVEAGYLPAASLSFLVAVQAAVRGETKAPPGLTPDRRREVEAWLERLDRRTLRARLGIADDDAAGDRPAVIAFADAVLEPDVAKPKIAFRWTTSRGLRGLLIGTALGLLAMIAAPALALWLVIGGAIAGQLIGRRIRVPRCSACVTVLKGRAERCHACGAVMRGDIANLSDRVAAEEDLHDAEDRAAS